MRWRRTLTLGNVVNPVRFILLVVGEISVVNIAFLSLFLLLEKSVGLGPARSVGWPVVILFLALRTWQAIALYFESKRFILDRLVVENLVAFLGRHSFKLTPEESYAIEKDIWSIFHRNLREDINTQRTRRKDLLGLLQTTTTLRAAIVVLFLSCEFFVAMSVGVTGAWSVRCAASGPGQCPAGLNEIIAYLVDQIAKGATLHAFDFLLGSGVALNAGAPLFLHLISSFVRLFSTMIVVGSLVDLFLFYQRYWRRRRRARG